jgi:hypothetical protein
LVLVFWLRQRHNGERTAIIIDDTGNQNDDNSAMRSRSVGSTRHHGSASNHTDMVVFVMVQTSSDTKVVGDLLRTVWTNQYGDETPLSISMTSKSVLILYVLAVFGIVDHTVIISAPLQTVASRNCHGFSLSIWQLHNFLGLNGARRRI